MYIYIYIYVHIYTYIYICIYTYIHISLANQSSIGKLLSFCANFFPEAFKTFEPTLKKIPKQTLLTFLEKINNKV